MTRLVFTALAVLGGALAGAGAGAAPSVRDPWASLRRPLHVPAVASDERCPVSRPDRSVAFVARFGIQPGLGRGPAYPIGMRTGVLSLAPAANFGSRAWGGQKVLWFVHPRYRGPVLVRGRRLDRPGLVRFERGDVPPAELRIPAVAGAGGERGVYRPSFTRLSAPGCYAYQIDGTTFSRVVVFRAVGAVASSSGAADGWSALRRPLHLPRLAPGAACPLSRVDRRVDWARVPFPGSPGIGGGPVYPGLGGPPTAVLQAGPDIQFGGSWGGQKVFWYVLPRYRGPVLIRGRRLDGSEWLGFNGGRIPNPELRIRPFDTVSWSGQPRGSRGWPSGVRVLTSGCYGVQIDGSSFSRVVVFRVELAPA